jgi:DNA polymerase III subunit epsilon
VNAVIAYATIPLRRFLERRRHRHGPHAALFAPATGSDWVALDLETTGLDPRVDEILSLAAVPCRGSRLRLSERLDITLRCDSSRIPDAIRHHRLRPADLRDGVPLDEALQRLLAVVGNRPLVGYCIDFDVAMIDRALRSRLGFGLPNPRIDVQREYAAWCRRRSPELEPDLRFEAIARALGVDGFARHRALDDALAAGLMHMRMTAPAPRRVAPAARRRELPGGHQAAASAP